MSTPLQIVAYNSNPPRITGVRPLEAWEVSEHQKHTKVVAEARDRLSLFRMLHRNFIEWCSFLDGLRKTENHDPRPALEELNRLLLNYLTFAYTIREHFNVSFQRRYRKDKLKQAEFKTFMANLCQREWSFGFFLDFRGHVQHAGLGVGHCVIEAKPASIHVNVFVDADHLLKGGSGGWKISSLKKSHGKIDLISHLERFHNCMLSDFGKFVASTFFPELEPASKFYGKLTLEARAKDASGIMCFWEANPTLFESAGMLRTTLNLELVPNDVFGELGIRVVATS